MVIGKSGTGKTAPINFLLSQVQNFDPKSTIFFFDKSRGAESFVRACGRMNTRPQRLQIMRDIEIEFAAGARCSYKR
jgi:type IV secretory pathway VirB4 component